MTSQMEQSIIVKRTRERARARNRAEGLLIGEECDFRQIRLEPSPDHGILWLHNDDDHHHHYHPDDDDDDDDVLNVLQKVTMALKIILQG